MCVKHTKSIYHLNGIEIIFCAMIITFHKVHWNSTERTIVWDLSPKVKNSNQTKSTQLKPAQTKQNKTKPNELINQQTNQPKYFFFSLLIYCVCRRAWNPLESHKMWSVCEDVDDWYDHQLHWSIQQPVHVNAFVVRRVSQNRLQRKTTKIKQTNKQNHFTIDRKQEN